MFVVCCLILVHSGTKSQEFANHVKLPLRKTNMSIVGVNNIASSNWFLQVSMSSRYSKFHSTLMYLVINKISELFLPISSISENTFQMSTNIKLADPNFYFSNSMDILLGTDEFNVYIEQTKSAKHPLLQNTKLRWIIAGKIPIEKHNLQATLCNLVTTKTTDKTLARFLEVGDIMTTSN